MKLDFIWRKSTHHREAFPSNAFPDPLSGLLRGPLTLPSLVSSCQDLNPSLLSQVYGLKMTITPLPARISQHPYHIYYLQALCLELSLATAPQVTNG